MEVRAGGAGDRLEDPVLDRLAFLAQASDVLASSLDYDQTLKRVAHLIVPRLADWCSVDLMEDPETITNVVVAHADEAKVEMALELRRRYPPDPSSAGGVPNVVRTGRAELHREIPDGLLEEAAEDDRHLRLLRALDLRSVILVPLAGRGRTLGAMTLVSAESGRVFDESDVLLAEELGKRAGLAIENSRLFKMEHETAERNSVLQELTASLAGAMTMGEVADVLLHKGIAAMGAVAGVLATVDEVTRSVKVLQDFGYEVDEQEWWREFPLDAALPLSDAIREGRHVVLPNVHVRDEIYPELRRSRLHHDHALVCLPLMIGERPLGGIAATFPGPRKFADEQMAFLGAIADQCAQAIDRANLYESERIAHERAESAWRRLSLLSRASELLAATLDYPATFVRLAELVVQGLSDLCLVDVLREDGSIERVAAAHADPRWRSLTERLREEYAPRPTGSHPVGRVIRTGQPEFSSEMTEDFLRETTRDEEHFRIVTEMGFQSFVCVPLPARGRILGTITLVSTTPGHRFGEEDVRLAEELARRAAVRIDNARLYHDRDHIARTLQKGLLPPSLPDIPGFELAAHYQSAGEGYEVGGDFYDVFETGDRGWAAVVGDVCGKGPEAAVLTGLARHSIRAITMHQRRPREVLRLLNDSLLREAGPERFCTVCYVRLRLHEGGARLTVSLGGHMQPIILRGDGRVERIGTPGTLLGVLGDVDLADVNAGLTPGDSLILFTDGVLKKEELEAFSESGIFGRGLSTMAGRSAEQLVSWMEETLSSVPPTERLDDVAILVLREVDPE